ncbi:hypothetical protein HF577_20150 [Pseudonocardia xinjiangensis]|uniref:Uncharacterized protein n=1 Tax=Pseudonocardia xinjiangensis TaxID=75289 RepID=A0ABX1RG84_9PSEU|nr:hypothetical protein [Pseudonocardia xinjiangensis]NMH79396.1 hypothetical protein [Pseudonocardia xinjiangensis]
MATPTTPEPMMKILDACIWQRPSILENNSNPPGKLALGDDEASVTSRDSVTKRYNCRTRNVQQNQSFPRSGGIPPPESRG